jgi:TctA family transporter
MCHSRPIKAPVAGSFIAGTFALVALMPVAPSLASVMIAFGVIGCFVV